MSINKVEDKNWTALKDGWLYKVILQDWDQVLWFSEIRLDTKSLIWRRQIREANGTEIAKDSPIRDDWKKEIFGDEERVGLMDKPDRSNCLSNEKILSYLQYDTDERASVEEHLGLCPHCSREVAATKSTMKKMFGVRLEHTDDTELSEHGAASSDEPVEPSRGVK